VKAIKVKSQQPTATLELPGTATTGVMPTVTFSGDVADVSATLADGNPATDVTLNTTEDQTFGYTLIPPVTNAAVTLSITTTNRSAFEVELPANTFAAGTAYNVKILFSPAAITPTATITDWTTAVKEPLAVRPN
jgi:hypothetical protein